MPGWLASFPPVQYTLSCIQSMAVQILRAGPVPTHVAFVMDGNRRFARTNKLEVREGHSAGFECLAHILDVCYQAGIQIVTVYAFSIQNFKRSKKEVDDLMEIAKTKLLQVCKNGDLADKYGIRVRILGEIDMIPPDVLHVVNETMERTKHNKTAILNICFPYTSTDDITQSIAKLVDLAGEGRITASQVTRQVLEDHMFTHKLPPLDILVRTSGVERLSDFMLWQCDEKTRIEFTESLWPEYSIWKFYFVLLRWSLDRSHELENDEYSKKHN